MKNQISFCAFWPFLLATFLSFSWEVACADGGYEGEKWVFLDPKPVLAAAAQITLTNYPDCDDATVDQKSVRVYRADGTGESQDEAFQKILTEKGKRENRTMVLNFMLPYSTVEVVKVEVIRPSGQVLPVDIAANSKEMIDDSQMEENIYDPNSKLLKVNIPQLEIGDVIHSITRTTTHRSIIPGEWADENLFEGTTYIDHLTYVVEAPLAKPLVHIALRDEVPGTVKYTSRPGANQTTLHTWEVSKVPRMFAEPAMPSTSEVVQRLLVSTTADWQTVSKWYWGISEAHLAAQTPEMKKMVDQLTKGTTNDLDKMKAIFYFVSEKIRYMGLTPEKDRPGFEPHDVQLTFGNKYGVCRDKAALLVSMLRLAGIKAYPVLISYGVKKDKDVPNPDFNHAIVAVQKGPGDYILLDPTDENTKVFLPSTESDQSFLVARPEGETILLSPIVPPDENMMHIKTEAVLHADGHLEAQSELSFDGFNDNAYRQAFSQMKPDDERRFFEDRLQQALPGAVVKTLTITPADMTDVSAIVKAKVQFSVPDSITTGSEKALVILPWIGKKFGVVNFILNGTSLEKRKYPMQIFVACGIREDMTVQLGADFTAAVSMPNYGPIQDKCLSYDRKVEFSHQSLVAHRELKLNVVQFSPTEYLQLKRELESMADDDRKFPLLAMSQSRANDQAGKVTASEDQGVESDVRILQSEEDLTAQDPHTGIRHVKYSQKILTYSGKKDVSEVKIHYNPAFETARIIHAVVTSATGQRQEISPQEINTLDESWNASAKRYTGGKILVANLPGVDVGSTLEVEYEVGIKGAPFLADFVPLRLFDDLDQKTFRLSAPVGMTVQTLPSGPVQISEKKATQNGLQTLEWSVNRVKALPREQSLPPDWSYRSGLSYFLGDAQSYWKSLETTFIQQAGQDAKAAALAKQLAGATKSKLETAVAIRNFVARSIRSAGPNFSELPLSELSPADTTLVDGYGNNADQAILLSAMLSAAGLSPEFVLASDLPSVDGLATVAKTFPLPDEYTAVLVKVVIDGRTYYLNDTDQYAQFGATPHDGKLALILGSQTYEVVQSVPGSNDRVEVQCTMSLSDAGLAKVSYETKFFGIKYGEKKRFYTELTPEEKRRYFQKIVSTLAQGARPLGDLTADFSGYPGVEKYTVEIPNFGVIDGQYAYFDLPYTRTLLNLGADHRALPFLVEDKQEHLVNFSITLPPSFQKVVIAPSPQSFLTPGGGQAVITVATPSGQCQVSQELRTAPAVVSTQEYPDLVRVESALNRRSGKLFLLQK